MNRLVRPKYCSISFSHWDMGIWGRWAMGSIPNIMKGKDSNTYKEKAAAGGKGFNGRALQNLIESLTI